MVVYSWTAVAAEVQGGVQSKPIFLDRHVIADAWHPVPYGAFVCVERNQHTGSSQGGQEHQAGKSGLDD